MLDTTMQHLFCTGHLSKKPEKKDPHEKLAYYYNTEGVHTSRGSAIQVCLLLSVGLSFGNTSSHLETLLYIAYVPASTVALRILFSLCSLRVCTGM
jgi:hypothetical protein